MGFGYRFHYSSYNSLTVPLDIGTWECTLLLGREYREFAWHRDKDESDQHQLEKDRRAFDLYFRPNYDFRRLIATDIGAITSFLSHHLNMAHWNLPTDNAGIERVLKRAVRDGALVPVVNRDYLTTPRTFRPAPAPLNWPPSGGGGRFLQSGYLFPPGTTSFNGEPVLSSPYDPFTQAAQLAALRGASGDDDSDGADWLGVVEAVAGAALGGDDGSMDAAVSGDGIETSTLLSEAQPFEYTESAPSADVFEIAKTPNEGEPGTWYTNPGSGQMRLYGGNGKPVVDFDFDHDHGQGIPHAHNWAINPLTGKLSRGPGAPMSILP